MTVVVQYKVENEIRTWTCSYDRLDHIISACDEKGFEIVGVEELS